MFSAIERVIASTYVSDIEESRRFFELLGFEQESGGEGSESAWTVMRHNQHTILLVSTNPPIGIVQLPLSFYFFVDDLDALASTLEEAGVDVHHSGNPPHALGGEIKIVDPDGNTILLGQRVQSAAQRPGPDIDAVERFSLLKESASVMRERGDAPSECQVRNADGSRCERPVAVKLADSWGDTAWACISHADEALVMAPAAFIASVTDQGLGPFLSGRRRKSRGARTAPPRGRAASADEGAAVDEQDDG